MVTRTNHVIPGPNLQYRPTLHGAPGTRSYCNIFLQNIGVDHKKALPSKSGAPGTVLCGKSGPDYFITLIKRLYESLI